MKRITFRVVVMAVVVMVALPVSSSLAAAVPANESNTQAVSARAQLVSYFENIGTNSPNVLAALGQSPETIGAIRSRIDSMSDEELAELEQLIAEMPAWEIAPEALVEALPLEMRQQLKNAGTYFASHAEDAQALREDAFTLIAVTRILSEEQLGKLGLDADSVAKLETTLSSLDPLQTVLLQERLANGSNWSALSRTAIDSLPATVQKGAMALAKHGQLTEEDLAGLRVFRQEILALADRVEALPPKMREQVKLDTFDTLCGQLEGASPDMLFMIRSQLSDEQIESMSKGIDLLERVASLTDEDLAALEDFRAQFSQAVAASGDEAADQIAGLRPDQLLLLQHLMSQYPNWPGVLPVVAETLRDPQVETKVQEAASVLPGSVEAADLDKFRNDAIMFIRSSEGEPDVTPERAQHGITVLENATFAGVALIREAALRMPPGAPPSAFVELPPIIAQNAIDLDCVVSLGSLHIPIIDVDIPLPSLNFNWICTPIEFAINAVESVIDFVSGVVVDIWNFVTALPQLLIDGIKFAFDALLDIDLGDGYTLRSLLQEGVTDLLEVGLDLLNLGAGPWWLSLTGIQLPEMDCPPSNTLTPFGYVGSSDTLRNYTKYKFIVDKLMEMIPDTEISLPVKIAANVYYAGFDYLGVCLKISVDEYDEANAHNRWLNSQSNQESIFSSLLEHDTNMTTQHSGLSVQLNNQSASLSSLIIAESSTIQATTQTAIQIASDLNLRLAIEGSLQSGEGNELALLQLPSPWGHLELVRDIVSSSIDAMLAVGEDVGQASKYLAKGDDLMLDGRFKDAFEEFQKAYREVSR